MISHSKPQSPPKPSMRPVRRAIWRGVATVMPPLLTVAILLWVWQTVHLYVLNPVTDQAARALAWAVSDIREGDTLSESDGVTAAGANERFDSTGRAYVRQRDGRFIPRPVYDEVRDSYGPRARSLTSDEAYRLWVHERYLPEYIVVPAFVVVFTGILYLLGYFFLLDVVRVSWRVAERAFERMPLLRSVYSSVKKISDLLLGRQLTTFSRVVAVEYPCTGVWSLGFVTSEGFLDISRATQEPMISVLMATSPVPFTGCVVIVPRRETIDLKLSVDQACHYIMSGGVVVPAHKLAGLGGYSPAADSAEMELPPR